MFNHDCWLGAGWSFVRSHLPGPPVDVIELGCGRVGGFVPALLDDGYRSIGVDPNAPGGPEYHRGEFEEFEPPEPVHAVIASASLHHVGDLDDVLDRVAATLQPGGVLVVVEFAWERFDEATARWCFARLPATDATAADDPSGARSRADAGSAHGRAEGPAYEDHDGSLDGEPDGSDHQGHDGWLDGHRDGWAASGQGWDAYRRAWAEEERLHRGDAIVRSLDERFDRVSLADGPYFFCDLADIGDQDEQAAIDAGEISPVGIRYVGRRP